MLPQAKARAHSSFQACSDHMRMLFCNVGGWEAVHGGTNRQVLTSGIPRLRKTTCWELGRW